MTRKQLKHAFILFSMLSLSFLVSCDDKSAVTTAAADEDAWKQTEYISITKVEELKRIPELPDKKFILVEDLDLSSEGAWTPLCSMEEPFTGEFDGNGHTLSGLTVSGDGDVPLGLFAAVSNARIFDLTLEDVSISCSGNADHAVYAGPFAGYAGNSVISGCRASGSVSAASSGAGEVSTGGIIGAAAGPSFISDCASSADLYSRTDNSVSYTGGIAGRLVDQGFGFTPNHFPMSEDTSLPWDGPAAPPDIRDQFTVSSIQNSLFNGTIRCYAPQLDTGATSYCGGICGDGEQGRVTGCAVLAKSIHFEGTQIPVYSPLSNLSMADNCAILEELDADAYEFVDDLLGQDTFHAAADAARFASDLAENALGVDLGISQYIPKYIDAADAGKASTYTDLGWDLESAWKMASGAPVPYEEQKPKILPGWYSYEKDSLPFYNYGDESRKGEVVRRVYENASAELIAKYDTEGMGGYCYGICMTTAGILNDMPEIGLVYSPSEEAAGWIPSQYLSDVKNPRTEKKEKKIQSEGMDNPNNYPSYIKFPSGTFDIHDYIETTQFIQSSADIAAEFNSSYQRTDLILERVREALENDTIGVPIALLYPKYDEETQQMKAGGHIFLAVGLAGNDILVDDSNLNTLSRFTITENGGWKYYMGLTEENPVHSSEDAVVTTSSDITKGYQFFMNSFRKETADLEYAMDETPPDETNFFDPDDPNARNIAASLTELPAKLDASDILVHTENGTITSDGGPVVPLGPILAAGESGADSSVPFSTNPSGLYWATDAGTVTVSGFDAPDKAGSLNTVEIAGDNTCIKVCAADDASVTSTIYGGTINTVIDTAAGNPAEITVTTYADDAPPKSMRLSGTSADGSVRIVQTKDGTLRAAGMKDMKASAATMGPEHTDTSSLSDNEPDALLEKLLAEHESSVPDSAPDKAADITMGPDGNGITAETDVPAPEILHPDVPQNKERSIYGAYGTSGACPFCGKVHGGSISEQLTAKFHEFLAGILKPFLGILSGHGDSTPKLPSVPGPGTSPKEWLFELPDWIREMLGL